MNAYLLRIYYNIEAKKKKPKEVWLKGESVSEIETKLKQKFPYIRSVEELQTIKNI